MTRSALPDVWLEAQLGSTPVLCVPRIVHLCLRKADQKLVIIKQIPVEQMTKEERQAAQNECQVLKLLNHPNVIEYYENFLEDKALMIAMEYAPGGPASSHWPGSKGPSLLGQADPDQPASILRLGLMAVHRYRVVTPGVQGW